MFRILAGFIVLGALTLPAAAGEEVLIDGVAHIRNGATPAAGRQTLQLQEVWRVGGPDDEDVLLGLISSVAGDEEGNTYIMDAQLRHVHVYGPEGGFLRTLFRQGEGPGEVQAPRDLVMLGDRSVGLVEEFPGKIVRVDREGIPLPSIQPGSMVGWTSAFSRGAHLICSGQGRGQNDRPGTGTRIYFLAGYTPEGQESVRYAETRNVWDFSQLVFSEKKDTPPFWWAAEVAADGRVYTVCDRDRYAISVFRADGTLERVIEREYAALKRSPDEIERLRLLYESAVGGMSIPYTIEIEPDEPAISYWHRALRLADDGTLWVVSSRGIRNQAPGIMLTYDVFDAGGRFIKQVAMRCEGDGVADGLFFVGRDRVVLVKGYLDALAAQFGRGTSFSAEGEEHSVPEVVCYRVRGAG